MQRGWDLIAHLKGAFPVAKGLPLNPLLKVNTAGDRAFNTWVAGDGGCMEDHKPMWEEAWDWLVCSLS